MRSKERVVAFEFCCGWVLLLLTKSLMLWGRSTFYCCVNFFLIYFCSLFENYSVFAKEHTEVMHFLPGIKAAHEKYNSEFHIVITKGKFLLNQLPEEKRKYDSCKILCYFYPGTTNQEQVEKTESVYVSYKGTVKWVRCWFEK